MLELGTDALLVMMGAVVFGALVKAVTGLGVPPIAIPVFAVFIGVRDAVVAMAVPVLITNFQLAWRYREHRHEVPNLGRLVGFALVGSVVGAWVLDSISERLLAAAIGTIVLGYLVMMVRKPAAAFTPRTARALAAPVAWTTGALQGATGLSAQVIVTYLAALRLSRGGFVFAVAILLQVSGLGQLIGVIGFGLLAPLTLQLGIATTVIVVTVIALVTPLAERLPHRVFEWGVRLVLLGSSLRLLYDAFLAGA